MKYFFNDVEVTEAEYKQLMSQSTPDVPAKFTQVVPNVKVEPKTKAKLSRQSGKKSSLKLLQVVKDIEIVEKARDACKKLIDEEYHEFLEAYYTDDTAEEIDACFDMMWVIVGYMKSRGWDCEAIWNEGSDSNLAKIDPTTGKVIRRPEDGKILKPAGWQEPNFAQFVK